MKNIFPLLLIGAACLAGTSFAHARTGEEVCAELSALAEKARANEPQSPSFTGIGSSAYSRQTDAFNRLKELNSLDARLSEDELGRKITIADTLVSSALSPEITTLVIEYRQIAKKLLREQEIAKAENFDKKTAEIRKTLLAAGEPDQIDPLLKTLALDIDAKKLGNADTARWHIIAVHTALAWQNYLTWRAAGEHERAKDMLLTLIDPNADSGKTNRSNAAWQFRQLPGTSAGTEIGCVFLPRSEILKRLSEESAAANAQKPVPTLRDNSNDYIKRITKDIATAEDLKNALTIIERDMKNAGIAGNRTVEDLQKISSLWNRLETDKISASEIHQLHSGFDRIPEIKKIKNSFFLSFIAKRLNETSLENENYINFINRIEKQAIENKDWEKLKKIADLYGEKTNSPIFQRTETLEKILIAHRENLSGFTEFALSTYLKILESPASDKYIPLIKDEVAGIKAKEPEFFEKIHRFYSELKAQ